MLRDKEQNEKFIIVPSYVTSNKKESHTNLLLIQDKYIPENLYSDDNNDDNDRQVINFHYCWIKSLSRLVRSQLSQYKAYVYDKCLNYFYSSDLLSKHTENCENTNKTKISFSTRGLVEFENHLYAITNTIYYVLRH